MGSYLSLQSPGAPPELSKLSSATTTPNSDVKNPSVSEKSQISQPPEVEDLQALPMAVKSPPAPQVAHPIPHEIGEWKILDKILGSGYAAEVRLAFNKKQCKMCAAKIIRKANLSPEEDQNTRNEIEILALLNHPNINKLIDWIENDDFFFIFLEYCAGGDMYTLLDRCEMLKESAARMFFRQIIDAVHYMHQVGVAHRDLKLENIYLDESWRRCFVGDFGLSAYKEKKPFEKGCGSPLYASPEVVSCQPYDGEKSDVWSLGVVLYTLCTGNMPFFSESNSSAEVFMKIMRSPVYYPDFLSPELKDLLTAMLQKDPTERISIEEIWRHPWMAKIDKLEMTAQDNADIVRRHLGVQMPAHARAFSALTRSTMRIAAK